MTNWAITIFISEKNRQCKGQKVKRKRTYRLATVNETPDRELMIEQHESH